jgi:hypothetical protein
MRRSYTPLSPQAPPWRVARLLYLLPGERTNTISTAWLQTPANADSARPHHRRLVCSYCYQSCHRKNAMFPFALTGYSSSQTWRILAIILGVDWLCSIKSVWSSCKGREGKNRENWRGCMNISPGSFYVQNDNESTGAEMLVIVDVASFRSKLKWVALAIVNGEPVKSTKRTNLKCGLADYSTN